ncbi:hypothetical protein Pcinc_030864 [Petrolisthes cinctipes]|uniref:Uncharacterized protein n=1 Tax=Petrolisthes cinctipes TaxID=88211 RepID=A0AAE1EX92_PETCI|nr:hypothetical protein Pcinc_030864 [Petrolisthes cinctipes]
MEGEEGVEGVGNGCVVEDMEGEEQSCNGKVSKCGGGEDWEGRVWRVGKGGLEAEGIEGETGLGDCGVKGEVAGERELGIYDKKGGDKVEGEGREEGERDGGEDEDRDKEEGEEEGEGVDREESGLGNNGVKGGDEEVNGIDSEE